MADEQNSWADFANSDPLFAARLAAVLPDNVDRSKLTLSSEQLIPRAEVDGESIEGSPVTVWTVLGTNDQGNQIRGHLLHSAPQRRLTPLVRGVPVLDWIATHGGLAYRPPVWSEWFRVWWRLGEPFFEGLQLIEKGTEIPPELFADYAHKEALATYDLDARLRDCVEDKSLETVAYAVSHKGDVAVLQAVVMSLKGHPEIVSRHDQFNLPEDFRNPAPEPLGGKNTVWATQLPYAIEVTDKGRRDRRHQKFVETAYTDPEYHMPGLIGDTHNVASEAANDYAHRTSELGWKQLLPPEPGDRIIARKAKKFVSFVNETLLDLHLPETVLKPLKPEAEPYPYTARIKPLPFYDCYDLIEVTEHVGGRSRRTTMLWAETEQKVPQASTIAENFDDAELANAVGHLVRRQIGLDGSATYFHAVNAVFRGNGRFKITREIARPYLDFFCDYVHGGAGSFTVIESGDDVRWRGFHHVDKSTIEPGIIPMRIWDGYDGEVEGRKEAFNQDTETLIEASVLYAGGVFRSIFIVSENGMVVMAEDNPLLEDLPTRSYQWNRKTRFLLSTFQEVSE